MTYINIENNNLACSNRLLGHVQEQYIPLSHLPSKLITNSFHLNLITNTKRLKLYSLKARFHASRENNHHWRLGASHTHQTLPYYQCRRHDHTLNPNQKPKPFNSLTRLNPNNEIKNRRAIETNRAWWPGWEADGSWLIWSSLLFLRSNPWLLPCFDSDPQKLTPLHAFR